MINKQSEIWDYLIVGAGVLGTAIAYYLKVKFPNEKILLLDKNPGAGQGNTAKSNAAFRNIFETSLNIQLCTSTIDFYKSMEQKGYELGLKEIGYLWLLSKDQYRKKTQPSINIENKSKISLIDFLKLNQISYKIFNEFELENRLPHLKKNFFEKSDKKMFQSNELLEGKDIKYGFFGKQCGTLEPDLVVNMYENLYKEIGGLRLYNHEVLEILLKEKNMKFDIDYFPTVWRESEVGAIKVRNKRNNNISFIQIRNLILATGAWINQLLDPLGIASGIKAKKRQLFRICGLKDLVSNEGFGNKHNSIPFTILPIGGVFIKPIPEANCVDVGCSDDIGRRFETRTVEKFHKNSLDNKYLDNPQGELEFYITNVLPVLKLYFPTIFTEKIRIDNPSAGMYSYTLDKYPIIEKISELGNFYFCSGASGSGIMKADSIARISVSLISGEPYSILFNNFKVKVSDFSINERNLPKETLIL